MNCDRFVQKTERRIIYIRMFWSINYKRINSTLKLTLKHQSQNLKELESLVEEVEGVHPGSGRTSRSVARNQVPKAEIGFLV